MGWAFLLVGVGVSWVLGLPSLFHFRPRHFRDWPWDPLFGFTDGHHGEYWLMTWALVAAVAVGAARLSLRVARIGRRGRLMRTSAWIVAGAAITGLVMDVGFIGSFLVSGPMSTSEMECWGGLHDDATWNEPHLWNATAHLAAPMRPPRGFEYAGPGRGGNLTMVEQDHVRVEPGGVVTIELWDGVPMDRHAARFASFARNATRADAATIAEWAATVDNPSLAGAQRVSVVVSDLDLESLARRVGLGGNDTEWGPAATTHGYFTTPPTVGSWEGSVAAGGGWTFTFRLPTRTATLPGGVDFSVDAAGRAHAEVPDLVARESTVVDQVRSALAAANVTATGPAAADVPVSAIC